LRGVLVARDEIICYTGVAMSFIIPKGFRKIALSENNVSEATGYYNEETKSYYFTIVDYEGNERAFGPITKLALGMLMNVLRDVSEMKTPNYLE